MIELKQVVVVNESLKLPRGKLAAQVAHASVASAFMSSTEVIDAWVENGMPKVVLSCESEDEVVQFYERAMAANLPAQLIKDAGKTVVASNTITCTGIGPATEEEINQITGQLKLLK